MTPDRRGAASARTERRTTSSHRSDRCYWNIAFPRPAGYSPISVGREVKELPYEVYSRAQGVIALEAPKP
jgi:hypothetical protein